MIELLNYLGVKSEERRPVIYLLIVFLVIGNVAWLSMNPALFELQAKEQEVKEKNGAILTDFCRDNPQVVEQAAALNDSMAKDLMPFRVNAKLPQKGGKPISADGEMAAALMKQFYEDTKSRVDQLKGQGEVISSGEKAQKLMDSLGRKANRAGLVLTKNTPSKSLAGGNNKSDFDEYRQSISFKADLVELTNFLLSVSSDEENNMVRVSKLSIIPTGERQSLKVDLTFIASVPKRGFSVANSKSKGKKK